MALAKRQGGTPKHKQKYKQKQTHSSKRTQAQAPEGNEGEAAAIWTEARRARQRMAQKKTERHSAPEETAQEHRDASEVEGWVYGIHPVREWIMDRAHEIDELFVLAKDGGQVARLARKAQEQGVLIRYRPRVFLDRLVPGANHQGLIARTQGFAYDDFETLIAEIDQGPLLFLCGVQDAGNLGTLLRSARAFGARGVVLSQRDSCRVTPAVIRASAGATSSLAIAQVRNVPNAMRAMREAGWWLLGLAPGAETIHEFDLVRSAVFVLGAEGKGLKPSIQKHCDALLGIPMAEGWDSLNVSQCGTLVLYEWQRQQFAHKTNPL